MPFSTNLVSSDFQTTATSSSVLSTASTSRVLVPVVLPATNTPTQTVTNTQILIPNPTNSGTPRSSVVEVQNPDNPDEKVTFGKTKLPESQRDGLPVIRDTAPLALFLLFRGVPTLVTVDASFDVVFPLTWAAWLTPALYPAAASIGDIDKPTGTKNTKGPTSTASTTSTSSCAITTVTDFYVSCGATSGAATKTCSTYSSVITSGCTSSVTAVTSTTIISACPAFNGISIAWPPTRASTRKTTASTGSFTSIDQNTSVTRSTSRPPSQTSARTSTPTATSSSTASQSSTTVASPPTASSSQSISSSVARSGESTTPPPSSTTTSSHGLSTRTVTSNSMAVTHTSTTSASSTAILPTSETVTFNRPTSPGKDSTVHPTSTPGHTTTKAPTTTAAPSSSLTCQQKRGEGAPSGESLKSSLLAHGALQQFCGTSFTPTSETSITYNNNFMTIAITRKSEHDPLKWCNPGINAIIDSCIVSQGFFGGVYSEGGETYTISNIGYPGNQNPLAPPTLSTTRAPPTTTKPSVPSAHTVTSNGMICVLIDGSNNPVCRPQSTPTPNPAGTNVHINSGCALVNGSPRCNRDAGAISNVYQSFYNVASDPKQPYSTTLILSGFDKSNDNHLHATASCQLQARWPSNYGDVYFGADGCLYDSNSNRIFNQCCSKPDSNNSGPATNPYVAPPPRSPKQSSGNHDGSSICSSISKNVCLAAASRFVDDIVYHQYTSAVWPDSSGADIVNAIIPIAGPILEQLFGINYGCTVIWTCNNQDAFNRGMTGKQIKDSMLNIYNLDGAKGCGSTYLDNSCHITVNGCNNCRDYGRGGTLWNPISVWKGTYGDAGDGFPPKR